MSQDQVNCVQYTHSLAVCMHSFIAATTTYLFISMTRFFSGHEDKLTGLLVAKVHTTENNITVMDTKNPEEQQAKAKLGSYWKAEMKIAGWGDLSKLPRQTKPDQTKG